METAPAESGSMAWLNFAVVTVLCWGLYGPLLHWGQLAMEDRAHGRYKAFLIVGLAYFLTAVLAPLALLWIKGAHWQIPAKALGWSLFAGILGALGCKSLFRSIPMWEARSPRRTRL